MNFKISQLVPRRGLNLQHASRSFRINEVTKLRSAFIQKMIGLGANYPEAIRTYEQSMVKVRHQEYVRGGGR